MYIWEAFLMINKAVLEKNTVISLLSSPSTKPWYLNNRYNNTMAREICVTVDTGEYSNILINIVRLIYDNKSFRYKISCLVPLTYYLPFADNWKERLKFKKLIIYIKSLDVTNVGKKIIM